MERLASYIFVLFDTGETEFLEPVFRSLDPLSYKILAFATSETLSLLNSLPVISSSSLNLSNAITKSWPREDPLNDTDLNTILLMLSPFKVCITGVASAIQGQILSNFPGPKIAIWDNLKGNDTGDYWKTAYKVQQFSSVTVYPSLSTLAEIPIPPADTRVLGHPSVESWAAKIAMIDQTSVRSRLGIDKEEVLVYIAGWSGDPECAQGTLEFARVVHEFLSVSHPEIRVIIQLHPRSDGNFEREAFGNLALVNSRDQCTTEEATAIAKVVVCHKTTAGPKIAAAGKKVIFLVPQDGYSNQLIEVAGFPLVKEVKEFEHIFDNKADLGDVYEAFGMPKNSCEKVREFLESLIIE